jgi:hypothetical protein
MACVLRWMHGGRGKLSASAVLSAVWLMHAAAGLAAGQSITVIDEHPRLVFRVDGTAGMRTFQTIRDLYGGGAGAPFYDEVSYWVSSGGSSPSPISEASRFVITGGLSYATNALNSMVSGSLSFEGESAETGIHWALAYDWIHSAWDGGGAPPDLAGKLATAEGKIAGWVSSGLSQLDAGGLSLWHGRAAAAAATWVAALSLPAGNGTYDSYRSRAFNHWQQSLKATHASGGWPEGPTYWCNNRAVNFPMAYQCYQTAVSSAPTLAVADPMEDLRAMGLWQAYTERGDGSMNRYGDVASAVVLSNGTFGRSIDYYAQITGDSALAAFAEHARDYRGSTRYHNYYGWMYPVAYDPNLSKPTGYNPADPGACLADALPAAMVFGEEALGFAVIRQGWSDGDTQISFKAGDYLAHHGHYDQGTFTLFKHEPLVINSGGYGPYFGDHRLNYYVRTASVNSILVQRPDELWTPPGGYVNDGGQRIVLATGSSVTSYENWLANKTSGMHYESGEITAFDNVDGSHSYVAADLTRAYNSTLYDSEGQGGKVSRVTRQMVYLHEPDVLVVFDRVTSTNAAYKKKWLLHTPNKMAGGTEVVARGSASNGIVEVDGDTIAGDTLTMTNGGGKLFLQVLLPASYTVNKVGGTSHRYYVEDDGNDADGYDGSNHDDYSEQSWHDYGNWRIEVSPKTAQTFDTFLNVLSPRDSGVGAVQAAAVLLNDAEATVMQLGEHVVGFGTAGAMAPPLTYDLPGGGTYWHLIVDLAPSVRFVLDNGESLWFEMSGEAGTLCFAESAAGPHSIEIDLFDAIAGDADLDDDVDFDDFSTLAFHFGAAGIWTDGDFDWDGDVDFEDYSALAFNFGTTGAAAADPVGSAVPEPATLALAALGGLALMRRRRRG